MAEKELVVKEKVEYSGIFSFSGVYSYANSWLRDKEEYGVTEDKYTEKVSGDKRDIKVEWSAAKKMGDYFKAEIKVEFSASDLVEVEVEIDGQKKKMNKGKVTLDLKGAIIKDHAGKWEEPFYRFLKEVYTKYVIPQRVENVEDKIRSDVKGLKEDVKSYLDLLGRR